MTGGGRQKQRVRSNGRGGLRWRIKHGVVMELGVAIRGGAEQYKVLGDEFSVSEWLCVAMVIPG